jgi:hypothetical protein
MPLEAILRDFTVFCTFFSLLTDILLMFGTLLLPYQDTDQL